MKKICIIGGSGFVGTSLINRLIKTSNYFIKNFYKNNSNYHSKLTVSVYVRSFHSLNNVREGSILINLAAEHKDDVRPKSLYYDVNVTGAKNVCKVAGIKNINKLVFTRTVAVYGFAPLGTDESGVISPFNNYGHTKW
jgi:nucleoside-diphosphate-sugar epimerase